MMSSLVPGAIFYTTGLNRKSTPTPPNVTPQELDNRYKRTDFDGQQWPADSPVSRAYDVRNSSTSMIILNNKYGKNSTRLRGYYSGPPRSTRLVDPERHRAQSPRNPHLHTECYNSSSPKFEPKVKTDLEWINSSQRPPNALIERFNKTLKDSKSKKELQLNLSLLDDEPGAKKGKARSLVNPRRHMSCMTPSSEPLRMSGDRPHSSLIPRKFFRDEYSDLTVGEKIYLWSIEKIYNVENLKQLKQDQYKKLLDMEARKGNPEIAREYEKYMRYINNSKNRHYGTGTPRSKSARSARSAIGSSGRGSPNKSERSETRVDIKADDSEKPASAPRPQTSVVQTRQQPLNDTNTRSSSASSDDQKTPRANSKSPSQSRKSSAKSTRSNKSVKSNDMYRAYSRASNSRASSAKSVKSTKSSASSKGNHSDMSSVDGSERETTPKAHHEGRDRPKSRLGHPGANQDRDKESIHSSFSSISIYSDKHDSSDDSDDNKKHKTNKTSDKIGSKTSINSKASSHSKSSTHSKVSVSSKSTRSSGHKTPNATDDQKEDRKSETDSVKKIHRVPSAGYEREENVKATTDQEKGTDIDKSDDNDNTENSNKETVKDVSSEEEITEVKDKTGGEIVKGKDEPLNNLNKLDTESGDENNKQNNVTTGIDISNKGTNENESETQRDDTFMTQSVNTNFVKQDSFDEGRDEESRRTKDIDKIEN